MRGALTTAALMLAAALALLWWQDGLDTLARWAADGQRTAQNAMAGALRALRAGEPGALALLMGIAFSYGLFHAVGPGHGKVLLGGYAAGTRVPLGRLALIGLGASLGQATTAVLIVHGGLALFDLSREHVLGLGEGALVQASSIAIALIGLWLCLAGARGLLRQMRPAPVMLGGVAAAHGPAAADGTCPSCGHRHLPTAEEVAGIRGWREAAVLIGAIAVRPCTGALFLLILTWRMGISAAGIAGTYVMALGTAIVTVGVAALAVLARDGAWRWAGRLGGLATLGPLVQLGAGALVIAVALHTLR